MPRKKVTRTKKTAKPEVVVIAEEVPVEEAPAAVIEETVAESVTPPVTPPPATTELPQVKKTYGKRAIMLGLFGAMGFLGAVLLIAYVLGGNNLVFGFISIPFLFAGGFGFYYYWNQSKDIQVTYVGDVPKEQVNSLCIYPGKIVFENIKEPEGFVWHWIDDGKSYYVYEWKEATKRLEPFKLPDQQYYDPEVYAQRVLTLPCHRKIFARKQDIVQKLKPVFAGLVGIGLWILILTTTAPSPGG